MAATVLHVYSLRPRRGDLTAPDTWAPPYRRRVPQFYSCPFKLPEGAGDNALAAKKCRISSYIPGSPSTHSRATRRCRTRFGEIDLPGDPAAGLAGSGG